MSSQPVALPSRLAAYRHYSETARLLPENVAKKRVAWGSAKDDQWKYSAAACSAAFVVIGLVHDPLGLTSSTVPDQWRLALGLGEASLRHHSLMAFYLPSILGALSSGVLCNLWPRHYMLGCLAILTSVSCMLATIGNFAGFVASHMLAGVSVGASLPLVYSLVGDWFPAAGRPRICALISTVSAATFLLAQATDSTVPRWRYSSFALACPALAAGLLAMHSAEDPVRGGQEDVKEVAWRPRHEPALLSFGHLIRAMLASRTTSLVFLQSIPSNLAWGMVVVSFRDFLRNDLLLSPASEFAAVVTVITTAFVGVLIGGVAGQALQASKRCHIVLLAGICNLARVVVFALLMLFGHLLVPSSPHLGSHQVPLFALLALAGAISTAATPCISTILLNFNLPETRGSAIAVYAGLEDVSKVIGATFAAILSPILRGRLLVHLFVLLLWLAGAVLLLLAVEAHEKDENQLHRRLDEDVRHRLVRTSKQNAQVAVQKLAKAAGEAHSMEQVAHSSPAHELRLSPELPDSLPLAPSPCTGTP